MTVTRIVLEREGYGLPTKERRTNEDVRIRCFLGKFIYGGETYPIYGIKHIEGNLYAMENVFKWHNYAFRPKWFQYPKLAMYYIKMSAMKIVNFLGTIANLSK